MRPLVKVSIASFCLTILKCATYLLTDSMIVFASFLDSANDTVVSYLNSRFQAKARADADQEHPYGHGGFEVVSSFIQGILIAGIGAILLFESCRNIISQRSTLAMSHGDLPFAAAVLVFSALFGFLFHLYLSHVRNKEIESGTRSLATISDLAHYAGDAVWNLSSAVGVILVWYTEVFWVDSLFGIIGALFFLRTATPILRESLADILQEQADLGLQKKVVEVTLSVDDRILNIHRLRIRRFGPMIHIDFHMKLPRKMPLENAHTIEEKVIERLITEFQYADVMIHLDPDNEPEHDPYSIQKTT